jgi:hypothetical protein
MSTITMGAARPRTPVDWSLWRRWTVATAAGEIIGFAAPALAGAAAAAAGLSDLAMLVVMIPAGMVEGAVLGAAQWLVLRSLWPRLDGRLWTLATALAAGLAYLIGMLPSTLGGLPSLPPALVIAVAFPLGTLFLLSIGGAQWLVLRRHAERAGWWILANAVAWPLGVAVPLLALTVLPDGTPLPLIAVTGVVSSLGMGLVVGAITGLALVRLLARH